VVKYTMPILRGKDAMILAELAQADVLPMRERKAILREAGPRARRIGRVLIGSRGGSLADRRVAKAFQKWARTNDAFMRRLRAGRATGIQPAR
jgi:hypothetical protein